MCQLSCVRCHKSLYLLKEKKTDKVIELVGGGFVINGATPSTLFLATGLFSLNQLCPLPPPPTSSHLKSFLEPAVPPIRLFLMVNMMALNRCVVKGNHFTALLRNEARNKCLISGPWLSVAKLRLPLPLDGAVYIFYSNLVRSNFPDKVGSNYHLFSRRKKVFSIVFNEFKQCLHLFIQIYIISKNGMSWPQLW